MISRTVAKTSIFNPDGFFGIHTLEISPFAHAVTFAMGTSTPQRRPRILALC
jgi:hypothetical protein